MFRLNFQLIRSHVPTAATSQHTLVPPTKPKWLAPLSGRLKLNTDAVVNISFGVYGLGTLLRNSNGDVIAAMAKPIKGCIKPKEMEVLAVAWSLKLLVSHRLTVSLIEIDLLLVVNILKSSAKL
ncbi:hypothetical protein G4B88_006324 [Cannabis sativa]|uniref:RNase H type-1 domain-containing protein n=1 Tax=Cannabis sativa TaxID=3483 RepID=A0A7J6ICX0_CANSA|nr:hypothetical protein G4B88_006324 [Cannabis sativa]